MAGKPITIIHGDCIKIIPKLVKKYDLIVTSPPYDAGKAYEGSRDFKRYTAFAKEWTANLPYLLKPSGSMWLNVGYTKLGPNETLPLTYLYHKVIPPELKLIQEVIWHYEGGMSYKKRFTHRTERWMWYALDPDNVLFNLDQVRDLTLNKRFDAKNHPLGKNPTDYWYFNRVVSGNGRVAEKTAHPCQFPEKMIERIVKACSPEGGRLLDPFAGSGTVGRVAKRLGRHATLIESNAEYISIIKSNR